jgi:hypothetical protein
MQGGPGGSAGTHHIGSAPSGYLAKRTASLSASTLNFLEQHLESEIPQAYHSRHSSIE